MKIIIVILLGYLVGSIQPAYIIGKVVGKIDIREQGTNNAGASNVTFILGWKYGILTGIIDILKAAIPILIIKYILNEPSINWFIMGVSVIIGHVFPWYLRLKGGKGTASFIGMMLAINFPMGLILSGVLVISTIVTDYIALGTIIIMILSPILIGLWHYSIISIIIGISISFLSICKHMPNVKRILKGEEKGLKSAFKK